MEMEALTACAMASATLVKALMSADPTVSVEELTLWHKSGGRSGDLAPRTGPTDRRTGVRVSQGHSRRRPEPDAGDGRAAGDGRGRRRHCEYHD